MAPKSKVQPQPNTGLWEYDAKSKILSLFESDSEDPSVARLVKDEGGDLVKVKAMDLTPQVWTDPTYDAVGRIYNLVASTTGLSDPLDPVMTFVTLGLGKDKDWVIKAIKRVSDAAKSAIAAKRIADMQSVISQYNEDHKDPLKALGLRITDLESQLVDANSDLQSHKETVAAKIPDLTALQVGWTGDHFYVDSETLKESKQGQSRGGGSRLPRDYSAGSWTRTWTRYKGVEGVTGVATVSNLDPNSKIGKGDWVVVLTVGDNVYDSETQETLNKANLSAIDKMLLGELGQSRKCTCNAPDDYKIPLQEGSPPVASAS